VSNYHHRARMRFALLIIAALVALAGCGSSSKSSSSSGGGGGATTSASGGGATTSSGSSAGSSDTSSCGSKPGAAATGSPINIGTIDTHQPGTDFTDGPNMIQAYFTCVNANGGVNGHPLKLFVQLDQTQPSQVAAAAKKLIQGDHVVAIDGVFDLLECTIDQSYWKQLGIYEMDAGIAPECWSTPNSAAVNMGPRYSSDGAVNYAISQLHSKKIVFVQSNVPGTGYIAGGPAAIAKAANVPITEMTENVPITDANSVAINLVNAAGPNGSVVLNFTPPEALPILQAAQKLSLEDRVKSWGCSTPCDTDFVAKALGPKWDKKLFVNAEAVDADDHNSSEIQLYKAILAKYGKNVSGVGSFSQFGFLLSKFLVQALQTVKGPYTMKSVNQAILGIKAYKSDMLCQPWTYGKVALHIPNNADYTVTPDNGKLVTAQGCTAIPSSDPQIAQYHAAAKAAGITPN
jgi:branched-chain amino acid transport system substrate-binding protein